MVTRPWASSMSTRSVLPMVTSTIFMSPLACALVTAKSESGGCSGTFLRSSERTATFEETVMNPTEGQDPNRRSCPTSHEHSAVPELALAAGRGDVGTIQQLL